MWYKQQRKSYNLNFQQCYVLFFLPCFFVGRLIHFFKIIFPQRSLFYYPRTWATLVIMPFIYFYIISVVLSKVEFMAILRNTVFIHLRQTFVSRYFYRHCYSPQIRWRLLRYRFRSCSVRNCKLGVFNTCKLIYDNSVRGKTSCNDIVVVNPTLHITVITSQPRSETYIYLYVVSVGIYLDDLFNPVCFKRKLK